MPTLLCISYPRITEERFQRVRMGCLALDNYEKRREGVSSSQRDIVFTLKPAWPKDGAHRAEPKFWVSFFVGERERIARPVS